MLSFSASSSLFAGALGSCHASMTSSVHNTGPLCSFHATLLQDHREQVLYTEGITEAQ